MKQAVWIERKGKTPVYGVVFSPAHTGKGYLQIVCDLYDAIDRYVPIMERLCKMGYVVFGLDLPGHGGSGGKLGNLEGARSDELIALLYQQYLQVMQSYPIKREVSALSTRKGGQLVQPFLHAMIGIGFGCSLIRSYMVHHANVNALLFVNDMGMSDRYTRLLRLCTKQLRQHGPNTSSEKIRRELLLAPQAENKAEKPLRSAYRSVDRKKARAYEKEETLCFDYDLASMQTLLMILCEQTMSQWISGYPAYLPLYALCGYLDPLTNYTREIDEMLTRFRYSSCYNVFYRYYENSRHDLLLESCQREVVSDMMTFIRRIDDSLQQSYEAQKAMIWNRKEGK